MKATFYSEQGPIVVTVNRGKEETIIVLPDGTHLSGELRDGYFHPKGKFVYAKFRVVIMC